MEKKGLSERWEGCVVLSYDVDGGCRRGESVEDFYDDLVAEQAVLRTSLAEKATKVRRVLDTPTAARRRRERFLPRLTEPEALRLAGLPGKALAVYLLLLRRSAVERTRTVVASTAMVSPFGVSRTQKATALVHLEAAGLLLVERRLRRNPIVTLLEV